MLILDIFKRLCDALVPIFVPFGLDVWVNYRFVKWWWFVHGLYKSLKDTFNISVRGFQSYFISYYRTLRSLKPFEVAEDAKAVEVLQNSYFV